MGVCICNLISAQCFGIFVKFPRWSDWSLQWPIHFYPLQAIPWSHYQWHHGPLGQGWGWLLPWCYRDSISATLLPSCSGQSSQGPSSMAGQWTLGALSRLIFCQRFILGFQVPGSMTISGLMGRMGTPVISGHQ